ncbi:MAG TPA: hypothetical protein DD614_00825 [Clostridiales bacterium]|nr:hypothetical protein [Clostridiales bacterium]
MKKPNIEDYGIIEEEYLKYQQYVQKKQKFDNLNVVVFICFFVVGGIVGLLFNLAISEWITKVEINEYEFPWLSTLITAIGTSLIVFPIYKCVSRSKIEAIKNSFQDKHFQRAESYYHDLESYNISIYNKEFKEDCRKQRENSIIEKITQIQNMNFSLFTTQELKSAVWTYYKGLLTESEVGLFDFVLESENLNIVCYGKEDNITKIEVQQFKEYLKEYDEVIHIYSINTIEDKTLKSNKQIKIITPEQFKKDFLEDLEIEKNNK